MRNAFASEVTKLASEIDDLVLLSGDIGNKLFDDFKQNSKGTFINCGIAEANMMGVASGLAMSGLKPIVYTITPFTTTRCFEQIRVDACYHNVNVIIVGTGSGLSYASLGPTHHSLEDLAIFRVLPHMTILAPADEVELKMALREALKLKGPVYIRIGKKGEKIVTSPDEKFEIGKSINHLKGKDIAYIVSGIVLPNVLSASKELINLGFSPNVDSFHTVKPLDEEKLEDIFTKFNKVCVVEEHSKIGGLFGAVCEWYVQSKFKEKKIISFGTPDEFMHEVGSQDYAREKYGLSPEKILKKSIELLDKE